MGEAPANKKGASGIKERWKKMPSKNKKVTVICIVIAAVIVLLAVAGIIAVSVINGKMGQMNNGDPVTAVEDWDGFDSKIYNDTAFTEINGRLSSSSFKGMLKEWATNGGEIMSSKNVLNILVAGVDTREGGTATNTDVMMLVSVNKKTQTITLTSFLRDSYIYMKNKDGSDGYNKLNAAYILNGMSCLIETVENNYKIDIDNYVLVDFEAFQTIIDTMGGIKMPVQEYEMNYINTFYWDEPIVPITEYGDSVLLTGQQALCYCRIRGCDADGDVSRTRRQRQLVEAVISELKSSHISDFNKYLDALLPYVKTGIPASAVTKLGMTAIRSGWYNFAITQLQMPTADTRYGYSGSAWIWAIDYPLAAQVLQTSIYGQTNIVLPESRKTAIDILRADGSGSGSSYTPADETNDYPLEYDPLPNEETPENTTTPVGGATEPEGTASGENGELTTSAGSTETSTEAGNEPTTESAPTTEKPNETAAEPVTQPPVQEG